MDRNKVYFVTRLKSNADFEIIKEFAVNEKHDHILSDQLVRFAGSETIKIHPGKLRVVEIYDEENDQILFLTNQLTGTADTISQLYKAPWDAEVFFSHLKQQFKVKSFVGTSANAVRIQMWCSMIAMLLVRYLKSKAENKWNLSNVVTFMRINLFSKSI